MKRAIVLAGGGSRGGYQIGAWQALNELGIDYHIVTGTSVGALNGAFMVMEDWDSAYKMWSTIRPEQVIQSAKNIEADFLSNEGKRLIWANFIKLAIENGGVDVSPLVSTIRTFMNEEKIRSSPIEFGLVTVEYPLLKPVMLTKDKIPQGMLSDYLLASASCFPLFKPTKIENSLYIDGGYADNMPVEFAVQCGAEQVIAIDLKAIGLYKKNEFEDIDVIHVRSSRDLGPFMYFDSAMARANIRLGYLDTMKAFGVYEGDLFTFEKGEIRKNNIFMREKLRLLQNFTTNINSFTHFNLLSTLNIDGESILPLSKALQRCAEITGNIMNVSFDTVYTMESFNKSILSAFLEFRSTHQTNSSLQTIPHQAKVSTELFAVSTIYDTLVSSQDSSISKPVENLIKIFTPAELLAAKYIYSLTDGHLT